MRASEFVLLFVLISFADGYAECRANREDILTRMSSYLTGRFTNEWDSVTTEGAVPGVRFFSARIWRNRHDGIWLYVEQNTTATGLPIRQRLYNFYYRGSLPVISFYALRDPERYVGGWKRPRDFNFDTVEKELKEGCDIYVMRQDAETLIGLDAGKNCTATIPGVKYLKTSIRANQYNVAVKTKAFSANDTEISGFAFQYNRIEGPCN